MELIIVFTFPEGRVDEIFDETPVNWGVDFDIYYLVQCTLVAVFIVVIHRMVEAASHLNIPKVG